MVALVIRADSAVGIFPAASSALVHGNAYTISGTGFGTRTDYNFDNYEWQGYRHMHWRWTDFANVFPANGSSEATFAASFGGFVPAGLGFSFNSNPSSVGLSLESGGPSQSGKYLRKINVSGSTSDPGYMQSYQGGSPIPDSPNAYISYKARIGGNGKVMRYWNDGGGTSNWYLDAAGKFTRENTGGFTQWFGSDPFDATAFKRIEQYLATGNSSRIWVDESLITYTGTGSYNGTSTTPLMDGQSWQTSYASWPNSVDPGGVFEYADIYFDFTAARVEVTVGSMSEVQILRSWSATSIAYVFNKGALSSGAGTLRVYDADNAVIHTESVTVN